MWMVRAGRGGVFYDDFKENRSVSIGWKEIGPLERFSTREDIAAAVGSYLPDSNVQSLAMAAGQLMRFRSDIQVGDRVATYDPGRRVYLIGTVTGPYRFDPVIPEQPNVRPVTWSGEVGRDLLSATTRNSLGAISTLFLVPPEAAADLERALKSQVAAEEPEAVEVADSFLVDDMQNRSLEFIKDRVSKLDWSQMQELVAGLLRAMGYKTRVSPSGSDRGKDIVASPDGLGFESPRIVVEVKHRAGSMGSKEIRSFRSGRHIDDKGLYVSTGGFSKDARYEAERASIPLSLMDIDDLVDALVDNYEALDGESKQLLPLRRLYWPI